MPTAIREPTRRNNAQRAAGFLSNLDATIDQWIFEAPSLADFAILPFVRQFAFIDKNWFDAQAWPNLQAWLERFLASERFAQIMEKYPQWHEGDKPILFGR
jgi:glutathione S-transferase